MWADTLSTLQMKCDHCLKPKARTSFFWVQELDDDCLQKTYRFNFVWAFLERHPLCSLISDTNPTGMPPSDMSPPPHKNGPLSWVVRFEKSSSKRNKVGRLHVQQVRFVSVKAECPLQSITWSCDTITWQCSLMLGHTPPPPHRPLSGLTPRGLAWAWGSTTTSLTWLFKAVPTSSCSAWRLLARGQEKWARTSLRLGLLLTTIEFS